MANINSIMGTAASSTSSIYGNRNILTGLASGMDTEAMIENSIIGYKTKIQNLIGQQTKLTWKQDAVRSITDKMIALSQKYTSYTSKTNLTSPSYFRNAVDTVSGGKNADKVSGSGRSTSDVQINAVKQLATTARYVTTGGAELQPGDAVGSTLDLSGDTDVGRLSGGLELTVGGKRVSLSFSDKDVYKSAREMVDGINEKLKESGDDKLVKATLSGDEITFEAGESAQKGDSVWISSVGSSLEKTLGIKAGKLGEGDKKITFPPKAENRTYETKSKADYLSGKSINVTLNGVTKTVKLGTLDASNGDLAEQVKNNLNSALESAFGKGKVTVDLADTEDGGKALQFNADSKDSKLKVSGDSEQVNSALGLSKNGVTNYLDTGKTLGELLGTDEDGKLKGLTANEDGSYSMTINGVTFGEFTKDTTISSVLSAITNSDAGVKASFSRITGKFTFEATTSGSGGRIEFDSKDASGNVVEGLATKLFGGTRTNTLVDSNGRDTRVLTDSSGKPIQVWADAVGTPYYLKPVDTPVGKKYYLAESDGTVLSELVDDRYKDVEAKDKNISQSVIDAAVSNAREGYTAGQDAIFNVRVNGEDISLVSSTNTVDLDGMSVTLRGAFNQESIGDAKDADGRYVFDKSKVEADSAVTFTNKASDELVDTIKSFVEEYNAIAQEVRSAYSTQPLNKSSAANKYNTYDPLTDEDKANMSESQITAYEEKAKTGLLFGDSDLRRAYDAMVSAVSFYGDDRKALEAVGISTSYANGVTTLSLDEDKLRAALDNNPDSVQKVFTQSKATGASSDGVMARVKNVMDAYASTSYGNYGVLVNKAGNKASSMSLMKNSIQSQIDGLDTQIDQWQTRMSDKIDYYTRQFTMLEKLMNQFNSQSSALAGLMGY